MASSDGIVIAQNVDGAVEYMELDENMLEKSRDHMLSEMERKKKARALVVPTEHMTVVSMLRQLDQPIILFGEDKPQIRERLRELLSFMEADEYEQLIVAVTGRPTLPKPKEMNKQTWYHVPKNNAALRDSRLDILRYSLKRSAERLDRQRLYKEQGPQAHKAKTQECQKRVVALSTYSSQCADSRPIAYCNFNKTGELIATSSWSGNVKVWNVPSCQPVRTFTGHTNHASCVVFHPEATMQSEDSTAHLASCCQDGFVKLWSLHSDEPLHEIDTRIAGVSSRVSRVAFHPNGRYMGACCHDSACSVRFYELETMQELVFQEGHSKPPYDIAFHPDGSLVGTGGLDCFGRMWDLRTGRCIMFLEGHLKPVLSVAFAPNGYHVATGGSDNAAKIWDLRQRRCIYTIPAHKSVVSKLLFEPDRGLYMASASFDGTIKIWSAPGWLVWRELSGHDGKVTCVDISPNNKWIATSGFDKTFKLWSSENI